MLFFRLLRVLLRWARSWPPGPAEVLKFGPRLLGLLAAVAALHTLASSLANRLTDRERSWLAYQRHKVRPPTARDELGQRRKLLQDLLATPAGVPAERIADAADELARCDGPGSAEVLHARHAAAEALAGELDEAEPDDLPELLELAGQLEPVGHPGLAAAAARAGTAASSRRRSELWQAGQLIMRVRWQLPWAGLGAGLSLVCGALYASKTHYQSEAIELVRRLAVHGEGPHDQLGRLVGAMLLMQLGSAVAEQLREKAVELGKGRMELELKTALLRAMMSQDLSFFDKQSSHELAGLVDSCGTVCHELLTGPAAAIEAVTHIAVSLSLLYRQSSRLTLMAAGLLSAQHLALAGLELLEQALQARRCRPVRGERVGEGLSRILASESKAGDRRSAPG